MLYIAPVFHSPQIYNGGAMTVAQLPCEGPTWLPISPLPLRGHPHCLTFVPGNVGWVSCNQDQWHCKPLACWTICLTFTVAPAFTLQLKDVYVTFGWPKSEFVLSLANRAAGQWKREPRISSSGGASSVPGWCTTSHSTTPPALVRSRVASWLRLHSLQIP